MALDSLMSTFVVEARERLEEMEYLLVRFKDEGDDESINAIFRAAHTIKGSGGLFGLAPVVRFAHTMEEALDMARDGRLVIDEGMVTLLLKCCDHLSTQVTLIEHERLEDDLDADALALVRALEARCHGHVPAPAPPPAAPKPPPVLNSGALAGGGLFEGDDDIVPWIAPEAEKVCVPVLPEAPAFVVSAPVPSSNRPDAPFQSAGSRFAIDVDRVDEWVDGLSELLIMASSTSHAIRGGDVALATSAVDKLTTLVQELRDGALALRTIELGNIFEEVAAEARDLAANSGREVEIEVTGGDTRLDHAVVGALMTPLRHLLVNAVEHGIGAPQQRLAKGKPARGRVRVNAVRDPSAVLVEVSDDGFGLDRERILAQAVACGLVAPGDRLAPTDVDRLVFSPDFTTRDDGVIRDGLDTVTRDIVALRGAISVRTTPGAGTAFTLRLPLSQSVVHGFQVEVGGSRFIIPVSWIQECVAIDVTPDMKYTLLRGRVLPLVHMGGLLGGQPEIARQVVVIRVDDRVYGVVVDALHGLLHTVVRPLGTLFEASEWLSGSTILPDGQIGLILDIVELVRCAEDAGGGVGR